MSEHPHPGEMLFDALDEKDMTQTQLSQRTGICLKHINEIIKGKQGITVRTALLLERELGITAILWLTLDVRYRLDQERRRLRQA